MENAVEEIQGSEIVMVNIADIKVGERFRTKFKNIESLAASIEDVGLENPVIIKPSMELVSGGRRIKAFEHLGRTQIPARYFDTKKGIHAEVDENNEREPFTVSEKVAIAEAIEEEIKQTVGERRGKKKQVVDSSEDENTKIFSDLKGETSDYIAKKAGFGNRITYTHAKEVMSSAIPQVIEAMDDRIISVNYANKIAQLPKNKQLTKLNEAIAAIDSEPIEVENYNKARRKAKRQKALKIPKASTASPVYPAVLLNPDWVEELLSDIAETPVRDYLAIGVGTLVIACPNSHLANAMSLVAEWGLYYKATITIYNKKQRPESYRDYINRTTSHLVFAQVDPEINPGYTHIDPVYDYDDLGEAIEDIFDALWDPDDSRMDMSATTRRKKWEIWKLDFAQKSDDSADSDEEVIEVGGSDEE